MKYDHLSSDQFWDVIYAVAKNKKKRKKEWNEILSPAYSDVVRNLAEAHLKRLDREITALAKDMRPGEEGDLKSMRRARDFIDRIRKSALRASEVHTAENKNIRRYETIEILQEYIAYLKDTLEDLHSEYVGRGEADAFMFYVTIEDMKNERESSIEDWIDRRMERRKAVNDFQEES